MWAGMGILRISGASAVLGIVIGVGISIGVVLAGTQVAFETDQHELDALAVGGDLADPLAFHVFQGVRGVDGVAKHDAVGIRVGQQAQAVKLFLARGVPEG